MRSPWRRAPQLDPAELAALDLGRGERVLAFGTDENSGARVVATTWRLATVLGGRPVGQRPWTDVDTGHWQPDTWTLTVTWVDRSRATQWSFTGQETRLPEVVHERVQASVVLAASLPLAGPRRSGRVVIRKDLRDGRLFEQVVLGRATPADDPVVAAAVARALDDLREQVGL